MWNFIIIENNIIPSNSSLTPNWNWYSSFQLEIAINQSLIFSANTVLGTCSSKDFRPNNFFDVSSAFKVVDFILYGSSIFKAATPTAKEMSYKLGIFAHSHLERYLYIYLHLKNYLPQELVRKIDLNLTSFTQPVKSKFVK